MTFLNPAALIGLLTASIPILIHLINLKKLKNIEFSSLMFLKELQKSKIRKIKIKQWLLLILRVLIVFFIVFSFARPTLSGLTIPGVTSAAKTTSFFLIDNSFSMSVVNQYGSFFNQAKIQTEKLILSNQKGDEIFLKFISDDSTYKLDLNLNDFTNVTRADNISYRQSNLLQNLILAAENVNKSKNFNREIFLFTDFQKNLFNYENEKSDFSELLNDKIKIYAFPFNKNDVINLSIDSLKPNNQIIKEGSVLEFLITITNHSKQAFQNRVLTLYLNDKKVAQKSFNIDANQTKIVSIETSIYSSGKLEVMAEIESDEIEYDNKNYLVINVPEKISVLMLSDEIVRENFIKLALQTLPADKINFIEKKYYDFSILSLSDYDVVILNADIIDDIPKLKNYIEQGGSLMIVPQNKINLEKFNNLISKLGLGKFDTFFTNESKISLQFDKVDFEHPIFKDLYSDKEKRKVDSPIITQFLKSSSLNTTPIITTMDNSKFLSEQSIGKGKVFIFNSAFNLNWSDFVIKSIFAPLIVKSIFYLSQKDFNTFQLLAGEEFNFNLGKLNLAKVIINRPDGTEDYIKHNEIKSGNLVYNRTDLKGIYRIFSADKHITSFSVNHYPSESEQKFISQKDFEKYLENINFKGQFVTINPEENSLEKINQARYGTELWKIFIILAIVTALLEMIISRNNKKEIESLNQIN